MSVNKFWTFWKIVALAMMFANLLLASYILFKFNMLGGLRDLAHNIDSTIVFSLSLLQTVIALGAFAGFWIVRGSSREAARDAAPKSVKDFMRSEEFEPVLERALLSAEVQSKLARAVAARVLTVNEADGPLAGDDEDLEGADDLAMAAGQEMEEEEEGDEHA